MNILELLRMRKFGIVSSVCLLAATCLSASGQQTRMLTADKHNEYGLVYRLPVTAVQIDVTARHTVEKAGPYFQYAKRFIGTDKVIKEDKESWEILDVKVTPYGIPDPDNEYLMQLKAGALTSICVADNGMLLAINKEVGNENTLPRAQATGLSSLASSLAPQKYLDFVDEDFLASQSSAKQAQMLAENIMEVRDSRISLTRGTAETMPTDGRQLELMLQSLENQEKAMTAAFSGLSASETVTRTFTFVPDDAGKYVLFRMSDFGGFVEPDDYSGEPVYIVVDITREESLPVDAKGKEKELPKDAVIYNIPGAARISLAHRGRTLWNGEMEFSQYGVQFGLQPTLFSDKKERSYAIFNPATGALEKIATVTE